MITGRGDYAWLKMTDRNVKRAMDQTALKTFWDISGSGMKLRHNKTRGWSYEVKVGDSIKHIGYAANVSVQQALDVAKSAVDDFERGELRNSYCVAKANRNQPSLFGVGKEDIEDVVRMVISKMMKEGNND